MTKITLDKGLLFGGRQTGEQVVVESFELNNTVIVVDGAKFTHGNIDRNRAGGYAVPRIWREGHFPQHWVGTEGFWHPANEAARTATQKDRDW